MNKALGYYTVGGIEFESKILACLFATTAMNKLTTPLSAASNYVKWHFNEDAFGKYNWANEPEETLDQLYDRRARELREKYDYIVVSYSGGADSHNVVMAFIRQKLHIDEIVVNTMEKGAKSFMNINSNNKQPEFAASSEHALQTIPRLAEIQKMIPATKIKIFDLTDHLFDAFSKHGDAGWVLKKKEGLNPLNVTRFNYLYFADMKKLIDKDKTIGIVLGIEKPRIFIEQGSNDLYIRFADRAANIAAVEDYLGEYSNTTVEFFYWSPDACDLLCKQAHTIKKWLELTPKARKVFMSDYMSNAVYRLVHERVLRSLLYSSWDDNWFQSDKALSDWHSEFDTWFIKGCEGTREHSLWKEGIDYIARNAKPFVYKDDINGQPDGLITMRHDYKIDKMRYKL